MFVREGKELTEAESIETMREMLGQLESSDRGTLVEQWYERYQAKFRDNDRLMPHPALEGMGFEGVKRPDFAEGKAIVEVKSSRWGLDERDVKQIEAYLETAKSRKGRMRVGNEVRTPNKVRVVFTEVEGVQGAMGKLRSWFGKYEDELTVEVFIDGQTRIASKFNELKAIF